MFGTLEPDVYFYGATIEKIGPTSTASRKGGFTTCVQPTPRWEIVSGSATMNLDDYVDPPQRGDPGEGRAGVLPADAVLPDPGGRSRHRLPDAAVRRVAGDARLVDRQRVLLGDQPQPGRHVLPRLDVLARQRASAPNTATCSGRRRRATCATTGSTRRKRSSTARCARRAAAAPSRAASARTCRSGCRHAARVDYFSNVTVQQTYNHNFSTPRRATAPSTAACRGRGATCR